MTALLLNADTQSHKSGMVMKQSVLTRRPPANETAGDNLFLHSKMVKRMH